MDGSIRNKGGKTKISPDEEREFRATIPSVFASQIVNSFKVAQEQGLDDTFEAYYKHIMAVGDIKVEPKERERVAEL